MEPLTEQELLAGARSFDLAILGLIYDQFSPGLYRYAMRLLGDENLAEDCVAETFSRFLKALKAGQGPQEHLQAYLYRIAHNWITDSYRRQPPPMMELDEDLPDRENNHLERQTAAAMEQQQVRLALRSLTAEQRQVVTLRFVEGWENEAVAQALEKPVGAIRALQHRALNTLRRLLLREEKEGIYESES